MEFKEFAKKVNDNFNKMTGRVFVVDYDGKELRDVYLGSFAEGTNPIYIERTEHDCTNCLHFIRTIGNVVTVNEDGTVNTVWDVEGVTEPYQVVATALAAAVRSKPIINLFLHNERSVSKKNTIQVLEDSSTITWDHFHADIPDHMFEQDIATKKGKFNTNVSTFITSCGRISGDALSIVLELIGDNNLARGTEFEERVRKFKQDRETYLSVGHTNAAWSQVANGAMAIHNTMIGTLLLDISEGKDLEDAVASYEAKVPGYKRSAAVVTKVMKEQAIKTIDALGFRTALSRRQAVPADISVSNVLFVDRSVTLKDVDPLMEAFGEDQATISQKSLYNAPVISMDKFLSDIVPKTTNMSLVTQQITQNKITISAPVDAESKGIFTWDNSFGWSYGGDSADSTISANVKAQGGKLEGPLRFSLQWNEKNLDNIDLDLHASGSCGHIYYANRSGGGATLDIDVLKPGNNVAVENIVWSTLKDGEYLCKVRHFSGHTLVDGFSVEVVTDTETRTYRHKKMGHRTTVAVATVTVKDGVPTIKDHIPSTVETVVPTLTPVKMVMLSPNHWDGQSVGNRHTIFITDNTQPEESFRGFYNEFLTPKLMEVRKAMEMLGGNLKCEPVEGGLSGYGFSSTKKRTIHVKADNKIFAIEL